MRKIKKCAVKIIMFISSYFPLYVMLLILHYDKYDSIEKIKQPHKVIFCVVILLCILLSFLPLILFRKSKKENSLKLNELERPDDTVISYMMTYVIPIVTTNFLDNGEVIINVILFLLIGYLYIRLNLLYLNPLLSAFGYLSYRVNSDMIVITDIKYAELKSKVRGKVSLGGVYLANDIFLALKRNN